MKDSQERSGLYVVEDSTPKPEPRRKLNLLSRLLAFLVTLALVLGAVTLVVYRDRVSFDTLRRKLTYRALARNDSGQSESFHYDGSGSKDCFTAVGNKLLVSSQAGLRLYSGSGALFASHQTVLDSPVAQSAGPYALTYSPGARSLFLCQEEGDDISSLDVTTGDILSARVNPSGYLAVTTRAGGYKGSVTVYTPKLTSLLQLNLSSSFLTDALVAGDNSTLAAVTMGQGEAGFESALALYALNRPPDQTQPDALCSLGGNLILDLEEDAAGYWALGDLSLTLVDHSGAQVGNYDYAGRFLKEFSLGGDGFGALLLGKYRAGTMSDLVVVDAQGKDKASLSLSEQVLSLSAAGRYVAVLTADRLDLYTSDLTPYASLSGLQGMRKVLLRSDGSALLVGSDSARLYIPD